MKHVKCYCKKLDKTWDWSVPVWLTKEGLFANCVIRSPEGKSFKTKKEANSDMDKVLKGLGIV